MDYEKQIAKKREEIEELQKKMSKELIDKFPDLSGRCFRPSSFTFYHVLSVDYVIDNESCLCSVLKVTYNEKLITQSAIVYCSNVTINLNDDSECFKGTFNAALKSALLHFHQILNPNQL